MSASSTSSTGGAAQRYAAALFDLALDSGNVDGIEAGLASLADLIKGDEDLNGVLSSPLVSSEEKMKVLGALAEKLELPDLATRFVGVVAQNRRGGDVPAMAAAFAARAALHRGATAVVARTAKKLTATQAKKLSTAVSEAIGKDVDVEFEVDPALIGGLQLRVGSRLVDASLRTKLDGMTNAMKGA